MLKRCYLPLLLGAAVLFFLPARTTKVLAQGAICGQFTDVASSSAFCPFILEAFITGITQGTSATTFNPGDPVTREQAATFFTRTMDQTLHRATARTAIGKSWTAASSGGIGTDVGGAVNDIVTDGTYLWLARNDSKILKVAVADRRLLETWSIPAGAPRKLGVFAGLVWIADNLGNLYNFNPTTATPGAATQLPSNIGIAAGSPALAFDGTNVWWASSGGNKISVYPVSSPGAFTFSPGASNVDGLVFDGTFMWVLLSNSTLLKMSIPTAGAALPGVFETITLSGPVNDTHMLYDGNNIWIPIGTTGTLYVVRPGQTTSVLVKNEAIPDVAFPYAACFDGESVMIGGSNNGTVALYKATNLVRIRTFASGAVGVRGIASDGVTFNIGDGASTKFYQF
jgi:hypothetical protein